MHMQSIYYMNPHTIREGNGRVRMIEGDRLEMGMDILERSLCLPSDNKMTVEQQYKIIEIIKRCFE